MGRLAGKVVPTSTLSIARREEMFALFRRYYEHVDFSRFERDLSPKHFVILLFDEDNRVQGFSTLQHLSVVRNGKRIHGVFSGDTVVDERYWGQRTLGRIFLRHLWWQKCKRPFASYWWFLISKGYKTYLLMANSFPEHYPRYERETPADAQHVLDAFAEQMFSESYQKGRGTIEFDQPHGQLKNRVAPITPDLLDNPRIAFYQERNPGWRAGNELACVAKMTWSLPLAYTFKALTKNRFRHWSRKAALPTGVRE